MTVCVRPTATENRIRARIEHAEFLGGVVRSHARWNGTPVVVTTDHVPDNGPRSRVPAIGAWALEG